MICVTKAQGIHVGANGGMKQQDILKRTLAAFIGKSHVLFIYLQGSRLNIFGLIKKEVVLKRETQSFS